MIATLTVYNVPKSNTGLKRKMFGCQTRRNQGQLLCISEREVRLFPGTVHSESEVWLFSESSQQQSKLTVVTMFCMVSGASVAGTEEVGRVERTTTNVGWVLLLLVSDFQSPTHPHNQRRQIVIHSGSFHVPSLRWWQVVRKNQILCSFATWE
jgi:hypothetical protein